jgi:hypothetical protein
VDAFAIDVAGDLAAVADGAGGLKIVDVSDRANPVIMDGEDLTTAVGTAEDVRWHDGHVYVAGGGAGVLFYENGDPSDRTVYPVDKAAEDIHTMSGHIAVGDIYGVRLYRTEVDGSLTLVGREVAARRPPNELIRMTYGVGSDGDLLLCANWSAMDVYRMVPASQSNETDISPSLQRIRFAPAGGTQVVSLFNHGAADLVVDSVRTTVPSFQCTYGGGTIPPGDSVTFDIVYDGTPDQGEGVVDFYSNDADENPLPIQVFGNTSYLDPGEPSVDFTQTIYRKDHDTGEYIEEVFTLSEQLGKVVWFHVYGTW